MRGFSMILRRLIGCRASIASGRSSELGQTIMVSSAATVSYSTFTLLEKPNILCGSSILLPDLQSLHVLNHSRNFSTPSSTGPSNVVSIESEEQFNNSLRKVQDESLPAIFYFTAVWCGPCRLLSPVIGQLSEKYPHVTTYKVDIDKIMDLFDIDTTVVHSQKSFIEEDVAYGLGGAWKCIEQVEHSLCAYIALLSKWKKTSEVIGADVQRLKDTMEELYK